MKKLLILVVLLVGIVASGTFFFLHKSATAPVKEQVQIATALYSCDSRVSVTASFYNTEATTTEATPGNPPAPSGKVSLVVNNGTPFWLPQTLSADGGRYANAEESIVFWDKGNGALFMQQGQKDLANCIKLAADPGDLPQSYASTTAFSLRYPAGFTLRDSYRYEALGPGKGITGIKLTIPVSLSQGTNLSTDSYISVEQVATKECSATPFLSSGAEIKKVTEGDTIYSVGEATDAAAGNRYHEIVYAIPGTSLCRAIRYFIHYGVFENYPPGTIKQFDEAALIKQFDSIRKTLILAS